MAIAFDATSNNGEATAASSTTWSHTVGASLSNGIIVAEIATRDAANADQLNSGVTYNAVAMTRGAISEYIATSPVHAELWYLVNPTSGANNVVASFIGTVDHMSCGAASFSGVDQTVPFVNSIQAQGSADDPTISPHTIVDNAWSVDAFYSKITPTVTIDGNRTQDWQLSPNTNGDSAASGTYRGIATAGATAHTWTTSASDNYSWAIGILRPAGIYATDKSDVVKATDARGSGSSLTFSFTVPSGFSNTILVVGVSVQDSNHANMPVTGITFNSVALTKIRADEAAGNNRSELWYLVNPDVTTANIVVSTTGTLGEIYGGAVVVANVDQSSPIDNNNGATGTASSPSVTMTPNSNNTVAVTALSAEERLRHQGEQAYRLYRKDQNFENGAVGTQYVVTAASTAYNFGILSSSSYAMSVASLKYKAPSTAVFTKILNLNQTVHRSNFY